MSLVNPSALTVTDLCTEALRTAGVCGIGMDPSLSEISTAQAHLQFMLQEWEVKRFMVYHLVTLSIVSNGSLFYTVGPGGDIDTGANSQRPAKLESAFLRQINVQPLSVDYPVELLHSMEDYNKIALKGLMSFPGTAFLDSAYPLGKLYFWPVPQNAIYGIYITVVEQLPQYFAKSNATFNLPWMYYACMLYNLAIRLRGRYQIGSFPGDELPNMAKSAMKTVRGPNTQIARLVLPDMNRSFIYNIFSDRFY